MLCWPSPHQAGYQCSEALLNFRRSHRPSPAPAVSTLLPKLPNLKLISSRPSRFLVMLALAATSKLPIILSIYLFFFLLKNTRKSCICLPSVGSDASTPCHEKIDRSLCFCQMHHNTATHTVQKFFFLVTHQPVTI